ncbi:MAG TPA: alanine--tRNA ligase [Clostridiaceae bacterium]|jgi:alanyl-tRNA synthetase|nr:alanine--tRNA ligase [Clostridium sp. CAG:452]HJJ03865.1 alanine--tRNA ligase [Clostridiaceae bacterium]
MKTIDLKETYLKFFESKGHKIIPSAPIIPENDPTCLFNTAGMQPLVPYLKGEPHPEGKRLTDVQKCFRTNDLDSIGDTTHHTFFEMLGNWSLGDYFKKESISWSFEFLTKKLEIPVEKLAVTVFKGNDIVPADTESAEIWESLGIKKDKIAFLSEEHNWWPNMEMLGPCGPDTEIFYWRSEEPVPEKFDEENENWVEIWNNVFMQYNHEENGKFTPLKNKNVDTGLGVERVTAILEGYTDNYKSSVWKDVIKKIEEISGLSYENEEYTRSMRIIADHIRAIVIIAGDDAGIKPSNTDQGYILRRLIRRTIRYAKKLNIDINSDWEQQLAELIINKYSKYYGELERNRSDILETLKNEKIKFNRTLEHGLKEFEKVVKNIDGDTINKDIAFRLYDTFGFPIELTEELAGELGLKVDTEGFKQKFAEHQEKSRQGSTGKFKGGLASTGEMETKYHTATHLLNAALKKVLGPHVHQKGSNITAERMRFDFSHPAKMTDEEKKQTEDLVNEYIKMAIPVEKLEMKKEDALKMGAEAMFIDKYGDIVSVYKIGDVSLELCGGPHVKNTSELGHFKIKKEEASSAGVRRIKAILE